MIVIMDQQSHLALPLKNGFSARPFREASGDRRGVEGASLLRQRSRDPHRPRVKRSGPRGPGEAAPSSNASTISGASSVSRSTRLAAISPTMVCVFAVLRIADLERELRLRDERIANSRTRSIRGASWLIPGPTVRSRLDHRSHLLTRGMRPSISRVEVLALHPYDRTMQNAVAELWWKSHKCQKRSRLADCSAPHHRLFSQHGLTNIARALEWPR
jgi:hypothetical protein